MSIVLLNRIKETEARIALLERRIAILERDRENCGYVEPEPAAAILKRSTLSLSKDGRKVG